MNKVLLCNNLVITLLTSCISEDILFCSVLVGMYLFDYKVLTLQIFSFVDKSFVI